MTAPTRVVAARLPHSPGVYRFREARGRVLYLGRATDLRRRVCSYWGQLGDRAHLAAMVRRIARVEAVVCESGHESAWLERNLLERSLPRWNRTPGGQEVPWYLRLDPRPRSAGLTASHTIEPAAGVRDFGPYLGGARLRLAVSGLLRVLPLGYTADNLDGAARSMARVRGVGPADRARFANRIAAVLDRDVAAVASLRGQLECRREDAVRELAFERAARVHAESLAIEWLVAPQKVTTIEPVDLDLHGWADGLLVRFEVRAGRLNGWRQRDCADATARSRVAATPTSWVAFVQRNAELAAQLSG
ncbi:MAG TPA: hypothetical protein VH969_18990 [Actinophytocola sp.]|jgi:excinuclease ABC subunit C|uniref:hypothetical protein n=1 Tax=Actinophytocola sp. TaxID=1872138 RepID=UPI002F94C32A